MDENFEKSSPAGGHDSSPGGVVVDQSANAAVLEKALNLSNAGEATPRNSGLGSQLAGGLPHGSILKIPVNVQVILGTTRMPLSKVMALGPGSVVTLDKELSEPVVLLVNGNEVARGLIVVVNEKTGQLGISLTEISLSNAGESSSRPV
jgi:flagellar motor switch protein FliN